MLSVCPVDSLATVSCHDADAPVKLTLEQQQLIATNDFENVVGWVPNDGNVAADRAHSGRYAVMLDQAHAYGLGFSAQLGQVLAEKPRKIQVSAWVLMPDQYANGQLTCQIWRAGADKPFFVDQVSYEELVNGRYGQWLPVRHDIALPGSLVSTDELRVFLWRASATTTLYLDDLRIARLE